MLNKIKIILIYFFILTIPLLASDLYAEQISQKIESFSSPSLRFNAINPKENIEALLNKFGATQNNKAMFQEMIDNEQLGFFGYHAGCSDYRIFQDVIKIAIEEYLNIPIRSDFQFLRTPLSIFSFESADAFVAKYPLYDDQLDYIKRHILSLNMALYKSWNAEWDFTPRYFLQNRPWTNVYFENELLPFFQKMGMDFQSIMGIFQLARRYVPQNKGMILQFFDSSHQMGFAPYAFLNEQAYIGTSSGKIPNTTPSDYYMDPNKTQFPQLRLVLNNIKTLNPNSPLIIQRYSTMSPEKEAEYDKALREFMRALPFDQKKAESFRDELLNYWYAEVT